MSTIEPKLIDWIHEQFPATLGNLELAWRIAGLEKQILKLESLQKACAEKDTVLSRILPEFMYEESFLSQRGKLTKQMLEHALSTDCGKDYFKKCPKCNYETTTD